MRYQILINIIGLVTRTSVDTFNGTSDYHTNLDVQPQVNRRSSFLFKSDDNDAHHSPRPGSRSASFSMER